MSRIHITAKRQATLPVALCEQMGVGPGDDLVAEPRDLDGERVWVLRPLTRRWDWIGAARPWAEGKDPSAEAIDRSIALAWAEDAEDE